MVVKASRFQRLLYFRICLRGLGLALPLFLKFSLGFAGGSIQTTRSLARWINLVDAKHIQKDMLTRLPKEKRQA